MGAPFELPIGIPLAEVFRAPPPPPDFVLPGLVAGTVGAFVSPGATGKSFWALEVAAAVAIAMDLLGISPEEPIKMGRVLVVAAEDPDAILALRLHNLGKKLNDTGKEQAIDFLDVMPAFSCGIDLFGDGAESWLEALIKRADGCRLIIIDTLSRVHTGEENERKDAARVMRKLERLAATTGAAVVFLHHITKSVALDGRGDQQQAARGSSVWIDEARWAGFLKTMDAAEAKKWAVDDEFRRNYVRYGVNKANYCAPLMDIWLKRDEGGVLVPAELAKGVPSDERKNKGVEVAAALGIEVCDDTDSL